MDLVGRDAQLSALRATIAAGRSAVVIGPPGSGRTSVLQRLVSTWTQVGRIVWQVHGQEGEAGVPLAAFAPLIAGHHLELSAPLAVYSALPSRLRDAGQVVVVDDVGHLDRASAVLLAQLARAGVACIASADELADLARTITDPALRSSWSTMELAALGSDDVLAIAADRLDDHLSAPSAALLVRHARGNPGLVGAILAAAAARPTAAGVVIDRIVVTDEVRRLVPRAAVLDRVGRLDAVEWLAVTGGLPIEVLDPDEVELLDRSAFVTVDDGVVKFRDELGDDIVLASLGEIGAQRRRRQVVGRLAGLDGWHGLRTLTAIRAGLTVEVDDVRRAVRSALSDGRIPEALELLDSLGAMTIAADLLLLGAAQSAAGDVDLALQTLGLAEAAATTDDELVRVGQELGLLFAVRRSDAGSAVERVEAVADALESGSRRAVLDTDLVKWRLMAGQPAGLPDAGSIGDEVAAVNLALITAMVETMGGDLQAARRAVGEGLLALERTDAAPTFAGDLLRLSQYLATAFGGDVVAAETYALEHRDQAARGPSAALGMWEYATAELALHAGRLQRARQMSDRAARHLVWRDFTGLQTTSLALRAAIAARQGRRSSARDLMAQIDDSQRADVKVELHLARADAEVHLGQGRPAEGAGLLAAAGRRAVTEGHAHFGVLAIDEAFIVAPTPELAAELADLADRSPLAMLLQRRAAAQCEDDLPQLAVVAREIAVAGLPGRAVQALVAAASVHERRGSGEAARKLKREAMALASREHVDSWPTRAASAALTEREMDVARLAAQRIRSREIAERLDLSVRTVDNHLAHAFRKLGITSRHELTDALVGETDRVTP